MSISAPQECITLRRRTLLCRTPCGNGYRPSERIATCSSKEPMAGLLVLSQSCAGSSPVWSTRFHSTLGIRASGPQESGYGVTVVVPTAVVPGAYLAMPSSSSGQSRHVLSVEFTGSNPVLGTCVLNWHEEEPRPCRTRLGSNGWVGKDASRNHPLPLPPRTLERNVPTRRGWQGE